MNHTALSIAFIVLALPGPAVAQSTAPSNSLARASATFAAADTNKDGKLSADEIAAIPIGRGEFLALDHDKDGAWERDEFLIYYRQRLKLAGQPVAADLEAETARIHALRKAKAAEEAKVRAEHADRTTRAAQSSTVEKNNIRGAGPAAIVGGPESADRPAKDLAAIEAGLQNALEHLEKRAAAGQATRADFQKVHDQLVARARAAASAEAPPDGVAAYGSEAYRKMLQSLDRLEKRAAEGVYSRDDYQAFRDMIIHRSRLIAGQGAADDKRRAPPLGPDVAAIENGLDNAIDALEKRAAAGHATREDFQRVRDQMIARARAAAKSDAQGVEGQPRDSDTYQKLMSALDRLEKRAGEGVYSREEYQELRALFIHRAREIQAEKRADGSGPAEARRASLQRTSSPLETPAAEPQHAAGSSPPVRESNPPPAPPQRRPNAGTRETPQPQRPAPVSPPRDEPKPEAQQPQRPTPPR
jgi:ethanolamine utilization microcompartment shell protein EutL